MLRILFFTALVFLPVNFSWAYNDPKYGPYHCGVMESKVIEALYAAELAKDDSWRAIFPKIKKPQTEEEKQNQRKIHDKRKADYFRHIGEAADWSVLVKNLCR